MLQAFNRHLVKYEENMRNLREKRNEPGWDFINFFMVQVHVGYVLCVFNTQHVHHSYIIIELKQG